MAANQQSSAKRLMTFGSALIALLLVSMALTVSLPAMIVWTFCLLILLISVASGRFPQAPRTNSFALFVPLTFCISWIIDQQWDISNKVPLSALYLVVLMVSLFLFIYYDVLRRELR